MLGCRAGKAVTIAKPSDKGHKEKVADLVDNKLLDEHDTVITVTPVISRHELEGEACTFVVLASAALLAALTPQQVVDIVDEAIKVGPHGVHAPLPAWLPAAASSIIAVVRDPGTVTTTTTSWAQAESGTMHVFNNLLARQQGNR